MNATTGTTKTAGLIAHPAGHTLSPVIHNMLADFCGIDMVYVPFDVGNEEELGDAVRGASAMSMCGLNVSVPYKTAVIKYLKETESSAVRLGAVNTLVPMADGGFRGYNTDIDGIYRALTEKNVRIEGESVIILGAGGVARPAAFMCADRGAREIFVLNRTLSRAEEVVKSINESAGRVLAHALDIKNHRDLPTDRKYLCIQCTSAGMYPDTGLVAIEDEAFYHRIHTAFDTVYRPMETRFISLARQAGAAVISGLSMLLYQGVRAFELWNPEVGMISDEICQRIYSVLQKELTGESIILTGFMGSGKTTVGSILGRLTGANHIDTDAAISAASKMTVSEIFERYGEEEFRRMETDVLRSFLQYGRGRIILSVGGGMPLRQENVRLMKRIGRIVYLKTSTGELVERLNNDSGRPLLQGGDLRDKVEKLMEEREERYLAAAELVIDTDSIMPERVAEDIIREVEEKR